MNLLESARMALRGLRANRLRSALTTLGIVIGVSAVIVLVAFGNGLQVFFNDTFGSFATQITVSPQPGTTANGRPAREITDADVEALADRSDAPDIASVTPVVSGSALMQVVGGEQYRVDVTGSTANFLEVSDREMLVGRTFDEQEARSNAKVVVLGPNAVAELFGGNAGAAVGQEVRIGRTPFRVIGVVEANGQQDDLAFMPLRAARSHLLGGGDSVNTVMVRAASVEQVPAALEQTVAIMSDRHGIDGDDPADRDFTAQALGTQLDLVNQQLVVLQVFTAAIAGISLVVGGIGVANIMLVSVTERTREIGIRKAIGARRRSILQQFLLEATMLGGFGGLLGVLIGVGLSTGVAIVLPIFFPDFPVPAVSPGSVVLSFSISLLIGLLAGGYPANRAARLRPIEALRYQ